MTALATMAATRERRIGSRSVRDESLLNDLQRMTLRQLDNFGWCLCFVRRPLFQDVTVVVVNEASSKLAIVDQDGLLSHRLDIPLRS